MLPALTHLEDPVPRVSFFTVLCAALWLPLAATAEGPDWDAVAEVGTIEVVTRDQDGDVRETTVWFAVVDGQGFIRTGGSTWGENVSRDSSVVLRIEGVEYPLRADFIEDETLRARIITAFREKYGWFDGFVDFVRGSHPKIMHLLPR
jgi:hypothetical protein